MHEDGRSPRTGAPRTALTCGSPLTCANAQRFGTLRPVPARPNPLPPAVRFPREPRTRSCPDLRVPTPGLHEPAPSRSVWIRSLALPIAPPDLVLAMGVQRFRMPKPSAPVSAARATTYRICAVRALTAFPSLQRARAGQRPGCQWRSRCRQPASPRSGRWGQDARHQGCGDEEGGQVFRGRTPAGRLFEHRTQGGLDSRPCRRSTQRHAARADLLAKLSVRQRLRVDATADSPS